MTFVYTVVYCATVGKLHHSANRKVANPLSCCFSVTGKALVCAYCRTIQPYLSIYGDRKMQELRFIRKQPSPDTLTYSTDTATPQTVVPIFYIHDGDHPFCKKPGCFCMKHDQELEALLRAVIRGEMHIRQVPHNTMQ